LRNENDSLKAANVCLKKCASKPSFSKIEKSDLISSIKKDPWYNKLHDSIKNRIEAKRLVIDWTDAVLHNYLFRTTTQLFIPSAWSFSSADLHSLIGDNNSETIGVRFYASIDPNEAHSMKLVAVKYIKDGNDKMNDQWGEGNNLYNFSKICPVDCDALNSPLSDPGFFGYQINN
jgi:hypothetical protein